MLNATLNLNFIELTKIFDYDLFRADLEYGLINLTGLTYTSFEEVCLTTLDHHAPIKKKIL